MIDKEYLYEVQKDAYEILNYIYETEGDFSSEILQDYSFQLSFEELLAELDEIFEDDEHRIDSQVEEKFGKDFLSKYIKYVNDVYMKLNYVIPAKEI